MPPNRGLSQEVGPELPPLLTWLDSLISLSATGLPNAGDVSGLSTQPITELVRMLGDPHRDAPSIHVTGTNGKGSTTHLISLILLEHGFRVGTYASPHVSTINERIQIDVEAIDDNSFARSLSALQLAVREVGKTPSWFEAVTAAAFRCFSDAAVGVQVVEVGMLGRHDATNVIDSVVSVVTNIDRDHTDGAPGWRTKVASEKAGIITPGSTAVLGAIDSDLIYLFEAEGPGVVLQFGKQFGVTGNGLAVGGRVLDIRTPRSHYEDLFVALHGAHQGQNVAIAIVAAEAFLESALEPSLVERALAKASLPARFEVISPNPLIVIDGGHNPAGAATAAKTFSEDFHAYGRRVLVVGMMAEKNPREMLEALDAVNADLVVCCQPDWPRALPAAKLAEVARALGIEPEVLERPEDAIDSALALSEDGDAILVAGSLYVAGAVRNHILGEPSE